MIQLSDNAALRVCVHREPLVIPVQDILFIEVFNWKCEIHRTTGGSISVNTPLKNLAEQLVSPSFIRCGRSFLVNLCHLTAVTSDTLILRGEHEIPVSRRERTDLIPYCSRFLADKK